MNLPTLCTTSAEVARGGVRSTWKGGLRARRSRPEAQFSNNSPPSYAHLLVET